MHVQCVKIKRKYATAFKYSMYTFAFQFKNCWQLNQKDLKGYLLFEAALI